MAPLKTVTVSRKHLRILPLSVVPTPTKTLGRHIVIHNQTQIKAILFYRWVFLYFETIKRL